MIRNITIGRYIVGDTAIHRLDPRTKILITLGFLIGLFFVSGYLGYAIISGLILIVGGIAGFSVLTFIRSIRPVIFVILITLLLHLFMTEGTTFFHLGPLTATFEGLSKGVQMAWRFVLLVEISSLLTLTTSPMALTDGLERLLSVGGKTGIPAHELAMMMTIALRFIPTLLDETERIIKAQKARGTDFESGSIFRRVRGLIPILVPLFLSAFRRADELAIAMEARCYRGGVGRTRMNVMKMSSIDYVAISISVVLLVVMIVI